MDELDFSAETWLVAAVVSGCYLMACSLKLIESLGLWELRNGSDVEYQTVCFVCPV